MLFCHINCQDRRNLVSFSLHDLFTKSLSKLNICIPTVLCVCSSLGCEFLLVEKNQLCCMQLSQEAGQVVWYSRLFKTFPQFLVIHTVKGFGIVNKAEIDAFLELSCFFH